MLIFSFVFRILLFGSVFSFALYIIEGFVFNKIFCAKIKSPFYIVSVSIFLGVSLMFVFKHLNMIVLSVFLPIICFLIGLIVWLVICHKRYEENIRDLTESNNKMLRYEFNNFRKSIVKVVIYQNIGSETNIEIPKINFAVFKYRTESVINENFGNFPQIFLEYPNIELNSPKVKTIICETIKSYTAAHRLSKQEVKDILKDFNLEYSEYNNFFRNENYFFDFQKSNSPNEDNVSVSEEIENDFLGKADIVVNKTFEHIKKFCEYVRCDIDDLSNKDFALLFSCLEKIYFYSINLTEKEQDAFISAMLERITNDDFLNFRREFLVIFSKNFKKIDEKSVASIIGFLAMIARSYFKDENIIVDHKMMVKLFMSFYIEVAFMYPKRTTEGI